MYFAITNTGSCIDCNLSITTSYCDLLSLIANLLLSIISPFQVEALFTSFDHLHLCYFTFITHYFCLFFIAILFGLILVTNVIVVLLRLGLIL